MILRCTIDGISYENTVNSDKPLNSILFEVCPEFCINNNCLHNECGNCIVLLNGNPVLSCLVPAFKLKGATIQTYAGFKKTRSYKDIEKAFENHRTPCKQCIASKTLLIESLVNKMQKLNEFSARESSNIRTIPFEIIAREISICKCQCMEIEEISKIVSDTYTIRNQRRVRNA